MTARHCSTGDCALRRRGRSTPRRTTTKVTVSAERGVFMISVAAELAEMHPQTLRMYEARGLIEPQRSPKGTRLYSQSDVERLRRIQEMTNELGLNLAGVERVLELEEQLERASRRLEQLERRSAQMRAEMEAEMERIRASFRAEIVPYRPSSRDVVRVRPAAPPERRPAHPGRARRPLGRRARGQTLPRVVPSSPPARRSASRRPGLPSGMSCGLISSWASGVSPRGRSSSGVSGPKGSSAVSSCFDGAPRCVSSCSGMAASYPSRAPHTLE